MQDMKLLQIDFPFNGPFGEEMTQAMHGLAQDIAQENGLIWKVWTENEQTKKAGGIYLFTDEENAKRYLAKHSARLESFGVTGIKAEIFDVNQALSAIDYTPLYRHKTQP
jgi:hypothetical protein